ncbi:MAG: preprotein translocase subunit YajC [Thermodesulfobacteriota bacterium]
MFASIAYAGGTPPGGAPGAGASGMSFFIMLIAMFAVFYFLVLRPQQKQAKEQQRMRDSLKKGDRVLTTGGIYGTVSGVDENTVTLEIAQNTRVKFVKAAVASLDKPGTGPAPVGPDEKKKS